MKSEISEELQDFQSSRRRSNSTAYTTPRFLNIPRCKGNKKIAEVALNNLLPCNHTFITAINPRVKLALLAKLSEISPGEICEKYKIPLSDLQSWSKLLTHCKENNREFISHFSKTSHRNLSREQKYMLLQECFGGPHGDQGPQAPFDDKSPNFHPANISALYGLSLYNMLRWIEKINVIGRDNFISMRQNRTFTKSDRIRILYEASLTTPEDMSKKYDVQEKTLAYWKRRFKQHGEKGLEFRAGQMHQYTPEEKVKIVQCYKKYGIAQAVTKYGLRRRNIRKWKLQIKNSGGPVEYLDKANKLAEDKLHRKLVIEKKNMIKAEKLGENNIYIQGENTMNNMTNMNNMNTNYNIKEKLKNKNNKRYKSDIFEDFEDYETFSSNEMNSSNLEDLYEQEMLITGKNGILPYEPTPLDIEMYKEEIRESINYMKASSIQLMQPLQYFIFQAKLEDLMNKFIGPLDKINNSLE